jgi:hypothetical protein
MQTVLIIAVLAAAAMVLFALARGLFHFSQSHQAAINGTDDDNRLKQNQMMFARVKWQAITIILLVLVGMFAAAGNG